jgi:2-(1,2-epoxy-1,2-dihydrophenyl)acetyl-CoA isomerase
MTDADVLRVSDATGVRTITLNRPDVLNAFNSSMLKALGKAARDAAKDKSVRCVVITGAGRAFCSGQDLAEVADRYKSDEPLELGAHLRDYYNPMIATLRTMEKPVVAATNGVAAGAGFSLALACDLRIAGESASFIDSFINVGLIPDSGGTFTLPRLVGVARAMEIAVTGRKVKSDEALSLGLVTRVVPDAELASATTELAQKLAAMPTKAIGLTKRAINESWNADLVDQLDYEAMLQTTAGRTHDHREGVVAFLEKRKPSFTGG